MKKPICITGSRAAWKVAAIKKGEKMPNCPDRLLFFRFKCQFKCHKDCHRDAVLTYVVSIAVMVLVIGCAAGLHTQAAPAVMPDGQIFDAAYYAANNPDVVAALGTEEEALYGHYLANGKAEGRAPHDLSVEAGILQQQVQEEMLRRASRTIGENEIGAFYQNSVLIGDSVAQGFSFYAARHADLPIFQNLQFLAHGGYSLHNAFWPVSSKSTHPVYQGQQRPIWESLRMMGARHIYTFLGLNDLGMSLNDDDCQQRYQDFINRIEEMNPGTEVTILSTTYMYRGSEVGHLNNAAIRTFNQKMQELALQNGWGYIDIADLLADTDGTLARQYTSDRYVHQTNAAYDIWYQALYDYAEENLRKRMMTVEW